MKLDTCLQCGGDGESILRGTRWNYKRPARGVQPEIQELFARSTPAYERLIVDLGLAVITDQNTVFAVKEDLFDLIKGSSVLADLLGRKRTILLSEQSADMDEDEIDETEFSRDLPFTYQVPSFGTPATVVPKISFGAAIEDLVSRTPSFQVGQTVEVVSAAYENRSFAAVRAADIQATQRVQASIVESLRTGVGATVGSRAIREKAEVDLTKWSKNYSDIVYQTTANTSYNAGTMQQSNSENLRDFVLAWQYLTTGQSNVRGRDPKDIENHWAMHQFIAGKTDPVWDRGIAPPMGYRCH